MTKKTENTQIKPVEALRNGWLAYLGVYGVAIDRIRPQFENLPEKTNDLYDDLIAKGEEVETKAQDIAEDVRERVSDFYDDRFSNVSRFLPNGVGGTSRIDELEAEIKTLNKKIAALTKKTAAKRTTKSRAKKAA